MHRVDGPYRVRILVCKTSLDECYDLQTATASKRLPKEIFMILTIIVAGDRLITFELTSLSSLLFTFTTSL